MTDTLPWFSTSLLPRRTPKLAEDLSGEQEVLSRGTRLDEFEIREVLGIGGFGVVYLAVDRVLHRQVAIKEYMPATLVARRQGDDVMPRSKALAETFALGLDSFCNEARMLASFDHPSLVKVYRFWRANGTAYMAMPYYLGKTLKQTRSEMVTSPDGTWLLALVEPLLGALDELHRQGVYHRDIAPDNILIQPDGRPVLLDFGSARRVIGDRTQSITAILKPNFAPVEQYADEIGMRQGPWTDLYALGATIHFMLTGKPPTPAVMRAVRDAMPALAKQGDSAFPGVQRTFLSAMDWTLALAPDDRPQSVAALRSALRGSTVPPPVALRHAAYPGNGPDWSRQIHRVGGATDAVISSDLAPLAETRIGATNHQVRVASRRSMWGRRGAVLVGAALAVGWLAWPFAKVPRAVAADQTKSIAAPATAQPVESIAPVSSPLATEKVPDAVVKTKVRRAVGSAPLVLAKSAPASPPEECSDRNFIARALCLNRMCRQANFSSNAQCIDMKRVEDQRQRRMDQ